MTDKFGYTNENSYITIISIFKKHTKKITQHSNHILLDVKTEKEFQFDNISKSGSMIL